MAFRLERDESVSDGLRRVIREELKSAAELLANGMNDNPDEAIHEARKSVKKVRAVLRMAYPDPDGAPSRENASLRDIAGRLSEFRDDAAIIETFDDLKKAHKPKRAPAGFRSVRAGLVRQLRHARNDDVTAVLHEASGNLLESRKRMKAWAARDLNGYDALAPGLEKTYRRGRKALTRALRVRSPENLHELRKRVKDHWYHVRLLEGIWSETMGAREKSLKDLETWLGEDHNLVVLSERLAAEPSKYGNKRDLESVLRSSRDWQTELRQKALPLAERVYEEKPGEFIRRMKHLWQIWKAEADSIPDALPGKDALPKKDALPRKKPAAQGNSLPAA
jgi:CHAD domain-containing protein